MSELYLRSILKLELDRVLEMLAQCAGSAAGKAACMRITPCVDKDDVQHLLNKTTAAAQMSTGKGYPSFSGISRSMRIKSGLSAMIWDKSGRPSPESPQMLPSSLRSMISSRMLITDRSSSII